MHDLQYGTRDKHGNWTPNKRLQTAPFWEGRFRQTGRFLIDYIWPWNAFHMATALCYWAFVIPDVVTLQTLSWGWALRLLAVNALGIFVIYGAVELFYYVRRVQGARFKYNHRFPSEDPSEVFWFKSQNLDNFLRSFLSGIPVWTLVQVIVLRAWANSWGNWVTWPDHWPWLVVLTLLVPAIHEVHFFCIHRLIHTPLLYKRVHAVHHNSINPSPWSSLSMHPVEHILYFAEMFWHLLIPSNPVVALFQLHGTGFGAINGHIGFDRLERTKGTALDSDAYAHHLHHKYFEVNYGTDGLIPLDRWFGLWHDGTNGADAQMKERYRKKKERANARAAKDVTAK